MGYYTRYELAAAPWTEEITQYLRDNEGDFYGIEPDGSSGDSCKWYDHEKHMKELSLQFPDVRFTLSGEGEEQGDIWEKHFLGGKMHLCKAEIVIPPFDPNKLV